MPVASLCLGRGRWGFKVSHGHWVHVGEYVFNQVPVNDGLVNVLYTMNDRTAAFERSSANFILGSTFSGNSGGVDQGDGAEV